MSVDPRNTSEKIDPASLDAVYNVSETATSLGEMVREAIGVIDRGLDIHGLDKLSISFNGGKDCTVLLHLLAAVLRRRVSKGIGYGPICEEDDKVVADGAIVSPSYSNTTLSPGSFADSSQQKHEPTISHPPGLETRGPALSSAPLHLPPIRSVYVLCPSPFKEVDEFVESSAKAYNLRLVRVPGSMRLALQAYLDTPEGHGVEAVLVGTRRNDPHGGLSDILRPAKLEFLQHCDPGWPKLLRVHPIINWSYKHVWEYLRHPSLKVPYCHLYDEGYTSLGSTYNTFKNPALQVLRPGLPPIWRPAFALEDGLLERAGRGSIGQLEVQPPAQASEATATSSWNGISKEANGEAKPVNPGVLDNRVLSG